MWDILVAYVLPLRLWHYMQYRAITDRAITTLNCSRFIFGKVDGDLKTAAFLWGFMILKYTEIALVKFKHNKLYRYKHLPKKNTLMY